MEYEYLKNGESLVVDSEKCNGCGSCVDVCPHAVFSMELAKSRIMFRNRCMECGACAKNCPVAAIKVNSGVGCASGIIYGILQNTQPSCGSSSGSCCDESGSKCSTCK